MGKKASQKNKVYTVENILDTKMCSGVQYYKVHWKGFPMSQCTWEPEQSFNCTRHTLNIFLENRAQKDQNFKQKLEKIKKDRQQMEKKKQRQKGKQIKSPQKPKKISKSNKKQKQNESQYDEMNSEDQIQGDEPQKNVELKNEEIIQQQTYEQKKQKKMEPHVRIPKQFKIISMKKDKKKQDETEDLYFLVWEQGVKIWKRRLQMHNNYAKQLCQFYEKHLTFDI